MSSDLKSKLYQMFILGLEGGNCSQALEHGLGGVIFFTKDIQSVNQFKNLINNIKAINSDVFLSIDQEGGRVERTENIHKGKKYLSARFAFEKGFDFLREQTQNIAHELKDYGINLNFAPCIDVNTNPLNPIIGERAFSDNPEDVINAEKIVSEIYRQNGIIPCVKHYPGHGNADTDSHLTLPIINLSFSEMERLHIKTFKYAIKNGADMVMAGHIYCPCFDKVEVPASLSHNAISYLRDKLNFNGVIISDDMVMKGVEKYNAADACVMGINAGVNMFIYRNSENSTIDIIESVYKKSLKNSDLREKINNSHERIRLLKSKYGIY